jgi:hypothetical protein
MSISTSASASAPASSSKPKPGAPKSESSSSSASGAPRSMSHCGLSSRARLDGPAPGVVSRASVSSDKGGGEGELRSSSMSHRGLCAGRSVDVGSGAGSGDFVEAEGAAAGAGAGADVDGAASALVVPVRNGRSKASLSLATFFGPKPGSRANCAASACAIFAKFCMCHSNVVYEYRLGEEERGNRGRTPNEARRVSTSVLFTCGILVSAVRRSALGVLSTRSRMSVGWRCSDCL